MSYLFGNVKEYKMEEFDENMERIFLLGFEESHIYENTTATKLAEHGKFLFRKGLNRKEKYNEEDILIRYGVDSYPSFDKFFGVILNRATCIRANLNKLKTALLLNNHGINTPRIYLRKDNIETFPVLRRRRNHSRGKDIIFIENSIALKNVSGDFFSQFLESDREYKCHVFRNECIRLSLKVPNDEGLSVNNIVRSYDNGWRLSDIYTHSPREERKAINESIKAVKYLGLDFGCTDVLIDKSGKVWILEVNTCPRLNRFGREIYTRTFYDFLNIPLPEDISMGLVKEWEHHKDIPIVYRHVYSSKEQKATMFKGL